jgi:hypothetical protein
MDTRRVCARDHHRGEFAASMSDTPRRTNEWECSIWSSACGFVDVGEQISASHWRVDKNWLRFADLQPWIVVGFHSTKEMEHRLMSPNSSTTLVPVRLTQFWQDPSEALLNVRPWR